MSKSVFEITEIVKALCNSEIDNLYFLIVKGV